MTNPLTGNEIKVSPIMLIGALNGALTIVIIILGWSYAQQGAQINRLQEGAQMSIQAYATLTAELKAHEIDDERQNVNIDGIGKKQIEVLSRMAAIEAHDVQTSTSFTSISERLRDLEKNLSSRIDISNDRLNEIQRQTSAIEGKLGYSQPENNSRSK